MYEAVGKYMQDFDHGRVNRNPDFFAADTPTVCAAARIPGAKVQHRAHDQGFGIVVRNKFKGATLADLKVTKL